MSQASFNVAAGAIGALALGAMIGACAAVYRTCRSSDLEVVAIVAAVVAGILVLGMLLGRWLLVPNRSAFLAAVLWLLAMAAGVYAFGARVHECFTT